MPVKSSEDKIIQEIMDKSDDYATGMNKLLIDTNLYADLYRGLARRKTTPKPSGFADTLVAETGRAVDVLSVMAFRMLTSSDPNFEVVPKTDEIYREDLEDITALLQYQQQVIEYKRKLLKALKSVFLFGSAYIDTPWMRYPVNAVDPKWEATDFDLYGLLSIAFDRTVEDVNYADWITLTKVVSPYKLKILTSIQGDDSGWIPGNIERALATSGNSNYRVTQRLQAAGYTMGSKAACERKIYRGPLESVGIDEDTEVWVINGKAIVKFQIEPYKAGYRPGHWAVIDDFELEPWGYGVGKKGNRLQDDLNSNRNRMYDIITFALFCMWKVGRGAGVKYGDLKIKPWNIIELDDINQLEPFRPDLNAVTHSINLESLMKEDFRSYTGAAPNLQAIVTEATATESSIAQSEAVRRISAWAEILAEPLVRQYLLEAHNNNRKKMSASVYANITGRERPRLISRDKIDRDIDFYSKTATDKDFRPKRLANMLQFLQITTSVRNDLAIPVDITKLYFEIGRMMGINMRALTKDEMGKQIDMMKQMAMARRAGQEAQVNNTSPALAGPAYSGEQAPPALNTPVGEVLSTP